MSPPQGSQLQPYPSVQQPQPPPQPYYYPPPPQAYPPPPGAMPGPYPPPYQYPVAVMPPAPPGKQTLEGLGRLKTATLLAIVAGISGILVALVALAFIASLNPTDPAGFLSALGLIVIVGILALVVAIIELIALIFGFMGIYELHQGRREFSQEHVAAVEKGTRFVIFAIVIAVAGGVAAGIAGVFIGGPFADRGGLILSQAISGGVGVAWVAVLAFGLQAMIEKLLREKGRAARQLFVMTAIGGAALALVLGTVALLIIPDPTGFAGFASSQASTTAAGVASLSSVVSIISLWIFRNQLMDAEEGAKAMISSGTYNPDAGVPGMPVATPVAGAPPM